MQELRTRRLSDVKVFEVTPDFTVASYESVLIVIWRTPPTVEAFQRLDSCTSQFTRERASSIAVLIVIEPTSDKPPSQAARQENVRLSKKYEAITAANATVLVGSGVKQSMARFVISTIQLMSPSRIPHSTFDAIPAAATWIAKNLEGVHVTNVTNAVAEARAIQPLEAAPVSEPKLTSLSR
jgi:hypothetical protein